MHGYDIIWGSAGGRVPRPAFFCQVPVAMPRIVPPRSIVCGPAYTLHKRCSGSVSRRILLTMLPWLRFLPCRMAIDGENIIFFLAACLPGGVSVLQSSQVRSRCTNCNSKPLKGLAYSREVFPVQFHLHVSAPSILVL